MAWEEDDTNWRENLHDLRDEVETWGHDIGLTEDEMAIVMAECFGDVVN